MSLFLLFLIVGGLALWWGSQRSTLQPPPVAVPAYDRYDYGQGDTSRIIDIGTQPSDLSPSFISECLFHDRILQQQLATGGWTLREHRYLNGRDMLPYCDGRLELMLLGDLPSFLAMAHYRTGLFAISSHGYDTIISAHTLTPDQLKGLRIGYPPGTSAHFTLDRALTIGHLAFTDIISVPLQQKDMESALRNHHVDAVIAWEPTASGIFAHLPGTRTVFRSETYTYIVLDLDFCTRQPALQQKLLAAVLRAIRWGSLDDQNLRTGLQWMHAGELAFTGTATTEATDKWINLLRLEGIANPSFPMLPLGLADPQGQFHQQFEFLKKNGLLADSNNWDRISACLDLTTLPGIVSNESKWQVDRFDYAPAKLFNVNKRALTK
ncbi:MAG: ABC transporter substrate-binding protein [bacterium]